MNNDYNQNCNLNKIRSKYIIIKIFDILKQNKLLNIINYKREYSKIEIEIIPEENKYGNFFNIPNRNKSYHIYFNDNKEEIKQKHINKEGKVNKIKIIIDYKIKSLSHLF